MKKKQKDFFEDPRTEDGGEKFVEVRVNTKPFMKPNEWRPYVLRYAYDAGPQGVKLLKLARYGAKMEWWQPKVAKHMGEKMRVAFATGLIFVPIYPGVTDLDKVTLVHPAFARVHFRNNLLNDDWQRMREQMMRQAYVDPEEE